MKNSYLGMLMAGQKPKSSDAAAHVASQDQGQDGAKKKPSAMPWSPLFIPPSPKGGK